MLGNFRTVWGMHVDRTSRTLEVRYSLHALPVNSRTPLQIYAGFMAWCNRADGSHDLQTSRSKLNVPSDLGRSTVAPGPAVRLAVVLGNFLSGRGRSQQNGPPQESTRTAVLDCSEAHTKPSCAAGEGRTIL